MYSQFRQKTSVKIIAIILIVMLALAAMPVKRVAATAYAINEWPSTPTYKAATKVNPPPIDFTVGAGPDLLLVVAVDIYNISEEGPNEPCSATYGGTAMTMATYQSGTDQTWIFYLPLGTQASSTTASLQVNIGIPHTNVIYWAAVYDHINQTNPISGARSGYTTGTWVSTYSFADTPVNAGGIGFYTWASNFEWKSDSEGYTKRGEAYSGAMVAGVASKTISTTGVTGPDVGFNNTSTLNVKLSLVTLNPLASSPPPTVRFDLQAASDTGISNTDNLTKATSPVFDAIFSEAVTGFEAGDLSNVGSATGCSFAIGAASGNTYPLTVSGCSEGEVILRLAAGAVLDSTYDSNAQTDGSTVTLDRRRPAVTFDLQSGSDTGTSNTDNITKTTSPLIDAVFNERVNGFTAADLSNVGSATGCSFALGAVSGYSYPITVTGCTGGTLIMNLKDNGVTDDAGNGNALTGGLTVTIDHTPPTITNLVLDAASDTGVSNTDNITNKSDLVFDLTYSEAVRIVLPDTYGNNGTSDCPYGGRTGPMSGNTQTVTFRSCSEGTVEMFVGDDSLTDLAGNQMANVRYAPTVTIDRTVPTVSFDLQTASDSGNSTDNLTNAISPVFDAIFNEAVAGFTFGDLSNTGSASGCSFAIGTKSGNTYPVTVSGCSDGTLVVRMKVGGVTDTAGNAIAQTDGPTVTLDRTKPTVNFVLQAASDTGISSTDNVTNATTLILDATFSKTVTGFEVADLSNAGSATGCSIALGAASGNTYPVTVSGCSEGEMILRLAAGGVTDNAGNVNAQTDGPTVYIDRTAPVVNDFTATTPSTSLDIPIPLFTASDPNGWDVTGFMITESSVAPLATALGWVAPAPSTYTVSSQGSHTLYPWVQDTGGNVSAVYAPPFTVMVNTTVPVLPTVTAFTATTPVYNSLLIPITAFTATGASGVTGYLITESTTPPLVGASGWSATAPTTYIVVGVGSHTLYAWAKDGVNVSALFSSQTVVVKFETWSPTVTAFTASTPANSLNIPITAFTATDAILVTGYLITASNTPPEVIGPNWTVRAPTSYTVSVDGTYNLYPWARNVIGEVSGVYGSPRTVVVDTAAPVVTVPANITQEATGASGATVTFTAPSATESLTPTCLPALPASGSTFGLGTASFTCSATDAAGNTGAKSFTITVQDTTAPVVTVPANMIEQASGPSGKVVTFSASATDAVDGSPIANCLLASDSAFGLGVNTVTCSATDAAGNTGTKSFTITVQDATIPVVTDFVATTPSNSIDIPISAFTADDTVGVNGYLITESPTAPLSNAAGWSGSAPTIYSVPSNGSYTLYPWARDAANNVSLVYDTPRTVEVDIVSSVTTGAASAITSTGATLNGTVNANGLGTTVTFEYGLTTSYGAVVSATPGSVTGTTNTSVSATISGLTANSTYHFRAIGASTGGVTNGADLTFKTNSGGGGHKDFDTTFTDVPTDYWAYAWIERLYRAGLTSGCATQPLRYCPDDSVTRAEMAVFLLRGMHGAGYILPDAISSGFNDVLSDHWAFDWIAQLGVEGITKGCGAGNYCPDSPTTRAEMAVFLLKSKHGADYTPPVVLSSGFNDVGLDYWAVNWIAQLFLEGITAGCGGGNYCPDASVTRAEMAVFLVRNFNLP